MRFRPRPGGGRFFQKTLDFLDQGAGADGGHPNGQCAGNIDAAGIDHCAGLDGPVQCFAGDQALVDFRQAVDHLAVRRDAFAGSHENAVTGEQGGGRHLGELAVRVKAMGKFGLHAGEIAGKQTRLSPHRQIEISADQQKEKQHDR